MKFGDFEISIIRESTFKLDGGAMFGVVPKALWANVASADAANRVELSCNLLFIQTPNGNVLIETGMGPRWSEKERARYDLKTLIDHNNVLESIGLSNTDVSAVVLSHLHFDHVGGACVDRDGKCRQLFGKQNITRKKVSWNLHIRQMLARKQAIEKPISRRFWITTCSLHLRVIMKFFLALRYTFLVVIPVITR